METLTAYFIKVNIGLLTMVAAYVLLLRKEKSFSWNRVFLLLAVFLPLLLPLLPGVNWTVSTPGPAELPGTGPLHQVPGKITAPVLHSDQVLSSVTALRFMPTVWILYGSVSLLLIGRFLVRLWLMSRLITRMQQNGGRRYRSLQPFARSACFLFFRWIVVNPSLYEPDTYREIIKHETAHAGQWHSVDILMTDLLQAIFWINPVTGFLKRAVTLNLEFAADRKALAGGVNKGHYQFSLLKLSVGKRHHSLANAFHSSKIKRRIYMMNSTRSTRRNFYRYLLILPFIAITYLAVSPVRAEKIRQVDFFTIPLQTGLTGYYQSDRDSLSHIHIDKNGDRIVLKQMWDGKEIPLVEKSPLNYRNDEHEMDLVFSKNASGEITKVLAFGKDTWIRINNYKPPVQKVITLPAAQMKKYAGKYSMDGHEEVLQFAVKGAGLEVTEVWRNNSFPILPQSEKAFCAQGFQYPVEFSFDDKGNVTQALIFNRDIWKRISD